MVVGDLGDDGAQMVSQRAIEIRVPAHVLRGDRDFAEGKRVSEVCAGDLEETSVHPVVGDVPLGAQGAADQAGLEVRDQPFRRTVGEGPARGGHGSRDCLHGSGPAQLGDLVLAAAAKHVPHHLDGFLAPNDEQMQALALA